ncbi:MAG TPA: ATP-binding protein [Longimicrobium sp.]|nr:ATP-binding protein [Longimicrobium sp.]
MGESRRDAAGRFDPQEPGGAYLAEASRMLADSLEYETTLANVAALALPGLGAWCIVDVVEEDGTMRRLAVVHPDPAMQGLARRLAAGWPPEVGDPLGVPLVARTRRAQVVEEVTDEMLVKAAHDEDNLRTLRALGIGSLIVAPMLARGHVHGAMTFVSTRENHYGPGDVELAEDLARRAAMAIENARLYRAASRARTEAEDASRAKSEFLAAMSHEMRTPLNAVLGYVDLLELELPGPVNEAQRTHLDRIRTASGSLLALVDQTLDLARLESGSLPVGRERADVHEAVEAAATRARATADAEGVRVVEACAAGSGGGFMGDPGRVAQVLDHLLSNAVKFTGTGGTVRVSCGVAAHPGPGARVSGPGPWACVEVEDTGMGIAPDRIDEMFEPFRQGRGGHTRTEGGAGLGLTIARHLARLMGGDVTARSTPGEGSCFTLWLPAASDPAAERESRAHTRGRAGHAIEAAGRELMCHVEEVVEAYARRLRADPAMPNARHATDVDLQDHAATLVADVAQSMVALGGSAEAGPGLLRDGSRIQRLVAELHAEQRRRLGWSEAELRRDFEVLREEVDRCVRAQATPGEGAEAAAAIAARLLQQTQRISCQAYRSAAPIDR